MAVTIEFIKKKDDKDVINVLSQVDNIYHVSVMSLISQCNI